MKKLFFTLFFSTTLSALLAQFSFDSAVLIQNLKDISADAMQGRKTGTEGSKKAQAYIIEQLKKIGVAPFSSDYLQSFTLTSTEGPILWR